MNELVRFAREAIGQRSEDNAEPKPLPLQVGSLITWVGFEGPVEARVDFLHTDPDGQTWAHATLSDGSWTAVISKLVTVLAGPNEQ